MTWWIVKAPEIWIQEYEVQAETEDEAISKVMAGNGTALDDAFEFSHLINDNLLYDAVLSDEVALNERGEY